jgi:hypothetical protein
MHFGLSIPIAAVSVGMQQWLQNRQVASALIKQHLHKATACMKFQADKGRTERSFEVGEWVFLKLQPYV